MCFFFFLKTTHAYIFRNYLQDVLLDVLVIGFILEFMNTLQYKYTLCNLLTYFPVPFVKQ